MLARLKMLTAAMAVVAAAVCSGFGAGQAYGEDAKLTVYCAHDSVFADGVLKAFEKDTGIKLNIRYDTEDTKSLGLIELLIREKENPRCDVFWNNEVLGMMDLQAKGALEPYKGEGWKRIPESYREPDGFWTGFGARMRVIIVNTEKTKADLGIIEALIDKGDLANFCLAKPIYGTTLTQFSVMWSVLGEKGVKDWFASLKARNAKILASNGKTKNAVAEGVCDFGLTDTDDFFGAQDAKSPVAMLPVRVKGKNTIIIPNTVGIIKGTKNRELAQKLADYLLSEKCELALANSEARQIPLGKVDETKLSADVKKLVPFVADGLPLSGMLDSRNACLEWLKQEFVK